MKFYQNNKSKKAGIVYPQMTDKHEMVVYISTLNENEKTVTLERGDGCLVGTGLHMVTGGGYLVFTHSSHVALHLDRYFFGKDNELMLQVVNPSNEKLTLDLGDEIASFVVVRNELEINVPTKVNSLKDLLE